MTLKLARALPGVQRRNLVLPNSRMIFDAAPPYLVEIPALSRRMVMDLDKRMGVYGRNLRGSMSLLRPVRCAKSALCLAFWSSARYIISGSWWVKRLMAAGAHRKNGGAWPGRAARAPPPKTQNWRVISGDTRCGIFGFTQAPERKNLSSKKKGNPPKSGRVALVRPILAPMSLMPHR